MPGYDRSRIVGMSEEDLEEFICGICLQILIKPTFTQCCGQTFCFDCINEWLQENNTCPNDRKILITEQLKSSPKMVTNLLDNLKIKCDFNEKGCKDVVKIKDLEHHKVICVFNPFRTCDNCGDHKLNHSDQVCIKTLVRKLDQLQKEHDQLKLNKDQDQLKYNKLQFNLDGLERVNKGLEKKVNDLQKEYDQFRQKKQKDEIEILKRYQKLKVEFDCECLNKRREITEFPGKWKLESRDNYDNFLKELGYDSTFRAIENNSGPSIEITRNGNSFKFKTLTDIKTYSMTFKLGEEFSFKRIDGKNVTSIFFLVGNKLIEKQNDNGKDVTYVREINGDFLTVTSEANNVKCVRVYKRMV